MVVPEALSRFNLDAGGTRAGASWSTREDQRAEVGDHVSYLDALYGRIFERFRGVAPKVTVLGFSQGATAACWSSGRGRCQTLSTWGPNGRLSRAST